jgi:hypothetical protein
MLDMKAILLSSLLVALPFVLWAYGRTGAHLRREHWSGDRLLRPAIQATVWLLVALALVGLPVALTKAFRGAPPSGDLILVGAAAFSAVLLRRIRTAYL